MVRLPAGHSATVPRAASHPVVSQSVVSQAFLGAVLVSTLFSLSLNVYLAGKLGVLEDFQSLENDLKSSFQRKFVGGSPAEVIKTAAEHHGESLFTAPGEGHQLAGLNCDQYGGPSQEIAQEMVYWEDIPSDNKFVSPFKQNFPQYLSFEPDDGGW
jgi:hypothetical protein